MKWLLKIFGFSYEPEPRQRNAPQKSVPTSVPTKKPSLENLPDWYKNLSETYIQGLECHSNHQMPKILEEDIQIELEDSLSKLLPDPGSSFHIVKDLSDENISTKKLASLVVSDPALSADSLKIVNSAAFGLANEITSIHQAITLMGTSNLKNLALQRAMKELDVSPEFQERVRTLAQHGGMVAAAMKALAEKTGLMNPQEANTIGILHDIGRQINLTNPNLSGAVSRTIGEVPTEEIYARIGAVFAIKWGLPQRISKTLEFQSHIWKHPIDTLDQELQTPICMLAASNFFANLCEFKDGSELSLPPKEVLEHLNLSGMPLEWFNSFQLKEMDRASKIY